jgi:transposase
MLSISRATRVFLATRPTDMRKGFDGLFALVENVIREDPLSGHVFVLRNHRRDRLKILLWDRYGLAISSRRTLCRCPNVVWRVPATWRQ